MRLRLQEMLIALSALRRRDEAMFELNEAKRLDPSSARIRRPVARST